MRVEIFARQEMVLQCNPLFPAFICASHYDRMEYQGFDSL
jgi:hypothetical protein